MTTGEVIALIKAFGGGGGSSGGGVLVVHDVDGTLDKTWQEIFNAMASGGEVLVFVSNENIEGVQVISEALNEGVGQRPYFVKIGMMTFSCETANDYPAAD